LNRDHQAARSTRLRDFFDDFYIGQKRKPEPTVFRGKRDAEQIVFGEELVDIPSELAALVDFGCARGDPVAHEIAHDFENQCLVFGTAALRGRGRRHLR